MKFEDEYVVVENEEAQAEQPQEAQDEQLGQEEPKELEDTGAGVGKPNDVGLRHRPPADQPASDEDPSDNKGSDIDDFLGPRRPEVDPCNIFFKGILNCFRAGRLRLDDCKKHISEEVNKEYGPSNAPRK